MATPLQILQGIAAAASVIASAKSILEDNDEINEELDQILRDVLGVRLQIVRAVHDILLRLDGISRQIDEDVAADRITEANTAFFSDLVRQNDRNNAEDRSFAAADRLRQEDNVTFASAFMYVVNLRLAVLKHFDQGYFCSTQN